LSKGLFEINFVEHENPFYQAGKLYTYLLVCELTTLSDDEFETGETDVDVVISETQTTLSNVTVSTLVSTGITKFYDGEVVFQAAGITGATYS
ncbi:hypothetical protein, partial [Escherichia coli]|uniref:hypothetical protein n=1 Tax=Escherichia coli TaxID=562 RepID=UPI002010581D